MLSRMSPPKGNECKEVDMSSLNGEKPSGFGPINNEKTVELVVPTPESKTDASNAGRQPTIDTVANCSSEEASSKLITVATIENSLQRRSHIMHNHCHKEMSIENEGGERPKKKQKRHERTDCSDDGQTAASDEYKSIDHNSTGSSHEHTDEEDASVLVTALNSGNQVQLSLAHEYQATTSTTAPSCMSPIVDVMVKEETSSQDAELLDARHHHVVKKELADSSKPRRSSLLDAAFLSSTCHSSNHIDTPGVAPLVTAVDVSLHAGRSVSSSSTQTERSPGGTTRHIKHYDVENTADWTGLQQRNSTTTSPQVPHEREEKTRAETTKAEGDRTGLTVLQSAASLLALSSPSGAATRPSTPPRDDTARSQDYRDNTSSISAGIISSSSSVTSSGGGASKDDEESDEKLVKVDDPRDKDVLCGRGRGYFCHPGNRRMLEIVEKNKARYRAANKTKKTEIVRDVTDEIEKGGTRFLKRESTKEDSGWFQVSAIEKHKKVCHCLREEKNVGETSPTSIPSEGLKSPERKKSYLDDFPASLKKRVKHEPKKRMSSLKLPSSRAMQAESKVLEMEVQGSRLVPSSLSRSSYNDFHDSRFQLDHLEITARTTNTNDTCVSQPSNRGQSSMELLNSTPTISSIGYQNRSGISGSAHWTRGYDSASLNDSYGIVMGNPRSSDVLFGQDPNFFTHTGNVHLRKLIQGSVGYPAISAQSKLVLAQRLVAEMKAAGSRFLTRQRTSPPGLWYLVDDFETETLIYRCLEEEESKILTALSRGRDTAPHPATSAANADRSTALQTDFVRTSPTKAIEEAKALVNKSQCSSGKQKSTGQSTDDFSYRENDSPSMSEDDSSDDEESAVASKTKTCLSSPGPYDVICGRGRGNFRHPGNRRMLRMFWNVKAKYNEGTKMQKTMIGRAIVEDITSKGGRFLKRTEKGWEEVEKKVVLRKVCHGIRDIPNDPEKRKRSIVADELEDYQDSDSAEPSTSANRTAPWLASEAKQPHETSSKNGKKTSISKRKSKNNGKGGDDHVAAVSTIHSRIENVQAPAAIGLSHTSASVNYRNSIHSSSTPDDVDEQEPVSAYMKDQSNVTSVIHTPTKYDVLCGRGRGFFAHPGNRRMLQIISDYTKRYKTSSKKEKGIITREILEAVQSNGARFLKRTSDGAWEVARPQEALQKVCHGIRDYIASGEGEAIYTKQKGRDVAPPEVATSSDPQLDTLPTLNVHGSSPEVLQSGLHRYLMSGQDGWGGSRMSVDQITGVPLHYVLAAHQQAEAEAAAVAAAHGGLRKLSPEEQLYLLHGGARLTQAETILLREREHKKMQQHRFL